VKAIVAITKFISIPVRIPAANARFSKICIFHFEKQNQNIFKNIVYDAGSMIKGHSPEAV